MSQIYEETVKPNSWADHKKRKPTKPPAAEIKPVYGDHQLLNLQDVMALTKLSRASIYRMEKAGYMPKRFALTVGGNPMNTRKMVCAKDIFDWIELRKAGEPWSPS